jgi:hypothetical protein
MGFGGDFGRENAPPERPQSAAFLPPLRRLFAAFFSPFNRLFLPVAPPFGLGSELVFNCQRTGWEYNGRDEEGQGKCL